MLWTTLLSSVAIPLSPHGNLCYISFMSLPDSSKPASLDDGLLPLTPVREVVTCGPTETIHAAAELMSARNVGSIVVVDEARRPLGIVTDTDLRKKVVAGGVSADDAVRAIMSTPVVTVPVRSTAAGTIITMMRRGIRHLCITEDGTSGSPVIGIISEHDVVLLHGNNPAVLAKEIGQAADVERLASLREKGGEFVEDYVAKGVGVRFVADMIAEVNDALTSRLIVLAGESLAAAGIEAPPARFCWLALGSDGRREQLIQTDQDTALVYEDTPPSEATPAAAYFLRLGAEVTAGLEACGFARCPGDTTADNPSWCQPLSAWRGHFRSWFRTPDEGALLNAGTVLDFRPVFGAEDLSAELRSCIDAEIAADRRALVLLARNAVHNQPATGLWERLNVERRGSHRGFFDLKLRAMKPVTEAARVLALDRGGHALTGTLDRLEHVASGDRALAEIAPGVVEAYELFMRYRVLFGERGEGAGRYLDLARMSRQDLKRLRSQFDAVTSVQKLIQVRYQLDALGLR